MEDIKQVYKELDFLDEKANNINLEMVTLEKEKNDMEQKKAELTKEIEGLEEEKKNILLKSDSRKGIIKYLYMIFQANADLKNIKIIDTKLEESRINLQATEDKLDIKNKLIKEKLEEKLNVWKRRDELYVSTTQIKEKEKQEEIESKSKKEIIQNINNEDVENLIVLYTIANQLDFKRKENIKMKSDLIKNIKNDVQKYLKENNIRSVKDLKSKIKKKEEENEC